MNLLLDTHVALWALQSGDALSPRSREAIREAGTIWLSVVSPWELTIKAALGKIALHRPVQDFATELQREFGAEILTISLAHVLRVGALPAHHGDPFDRLLIAQAQTERLTLVTRDDAFARYDVPLILA